MRTEQFFYWFSKPLVIAYTSTMLQMDIHRTFHLPAGGKIFAANHPSTTDPFYVASMIRAQSYILIHELLFKVPVLGSYLRASGHIPVQPGQGDQAICAAVERLKAGQNILIFPEGVLSPIQGGFAPARTGVARIALLSQAPVIPVGIHLERRKLHLAASRVDGQVEQSAWYPRGTYTMTVGEPLRFHGSATERERVRGIASIVMHNIIELARQSELRARQKNPALSSVLQSPS